MGKSAPCVGNGMRGKTLERHQSDHLHLLNRLSTEVVPCDLRLYARPLFEICPVGDYGVRSACELGCADDDTERPLFAPADHPAIRRNAHSDPRLAKVEDLELDALVE